MPQTISILCIDDEPLFLDAFKSRLEQEPDLSVTVTSTGSEALDLLNQQYFDVIISDYSMPDMDGLSLLREIRARGGQSIFVVATAKTLAHIAKEALNTGADYYLQKGADMANEVSRLIDFVRTRVPQKNAEYEMIAWARFYNSIVDNCDLLICRIKPDGAITFVNDPSVHFFKKPYRQLVQENLFSFIPEGEREEIRTHIASLTPDKPDCLLLHHIITGSGELLAFEMGYHVFYSSQGELQEFQVTGRDPEKLVKIGGTGVPRPAAGQPVPAQRTKKAEWSELVTTLQSLDVPVFAVDLTGTVIAWSAKLAELTGYSPAAMIGKGNREYGIPFYGTPHAMLVDHVIRQAGVIQGGDLPPMKKSGDMFIGAREQVKIRGMPMIMIGKCSPVYDSAGKLIAAVEAVTVSEVAVTVPKAAAPVPESEGYIGGISSLTLKVAGDGMGGAIAGAIGSSDGGYGVYATNKRIFVIRNPDLDISSSKNVQFGAFIMDEFFGRGADTRQKTLGELENTRVFEAERDEIEKIVLKRPVLLSGFMEITKKGMPPFRLYIDHKKTFAYIENMVRSFAPGVISTE